MKKLREVYFDNAATSYPKPPAVWEAMKHYLLEVGGSPGRSGHARSLRAGEIIARARLSLSRLFHISSPESIVFTLNATSALNYALKGILKEGDEALIGPWEHNSVLRPLRALAADKKITIKIIPCSPRGELDPDDVRRGITPRTGLIVINQASNVLGTIIPLEAIGRIAREAGVPFLVDAAQSAGAVPIDAERMFIDLLAFTGHKSLFGPQGTGGLYIRPGLEVRTLLEGGTGSSSESELQPDFMPDKFESGTLNGVGIAGLAAGVDFIRKEGEAAIRDKEISLTNYLLRKMSSLKGVTIYGDRPAEERVPVVSFNLRGWEPVEAGIVLDNNFRIRARTGLHCAPGAHRWAGTFPKGAIRFSLGYFNRTEEIDCAVGALEEMLSAQ